MDAPSISVITPVYNGMPFIRECIESILQQDCENWEMIISDNNSNDGTTEYLKTITDPRIKIFYQIENLGIFGNLNFAFNQATSEFSQILCADDYLFNKKSLIKIIEYWKKAEMEIGFCRFNSSDKIQNTFLPKVIKSENADLIFFIFWNIPGNLSNVSLRTNIVRDIGWFSIDLPYAGDFDFWVRSARKFSMGFEQDNICYIRRHPGVASNYLNKKGELLGQNAYILNTLFKNIIAQNPNSFFLLKLHGTLCFDSIQLSHALLKFIKGNKDFLKVLNHIHPNFDFYFKNPLVRYIIFILSLGGRIGRTITAKYLLQLKKIITF
jgi:glycosyltransferase involved in cell wall biosynthesis